MAPFGMWYPAKVVTYNETKLQITQAYKLLKKGTLTFKIS